MSFKRLNMIFLIVCFLLSLASSEVLVLQNGLNGYDGCIDGYYSTKEGSLGKSGNETTLKTYHNC